jgi:hypothetical protein
MATNRKDHSSVHFEGGVIKGDDIKRENGIVRLPIATRRALAIGYAHTKPHTKKAQDEIFDTLKKNAVTLDEFTVMIVDGIVNEYVKVEKSLNVNDLVKTVQDLQAQLAVLQAQAQVPAIAQPAGQPPAQVPAQVPAKAPPAKSGGKGKSNKPAVDLDEHANDPSVFDKFPANSE